MAVRDNIVGRIFGKLSVLSVDGKNKHGKYSVRCRCKCGNECVVLEALLKNGKTKSCGCLHSEVVSLTVRKDYVGIKSGRLTMIKDVGTNGKERLWECKCECGNVVVRLGAHVKSGHIRSCGCLKADSSRLANTSHGKSSSKEYSTYNGMLERCYNENCEKFPIYGGRGIVVCERWRNSFANFYEDMGDKPEGLTLERIDVSGNYCPENCMWDTPTEQAFNQRRRKDNTSGRVGVTLCKDGRWKAKIWKNKKGYNLGIFDSFDDAVSARENAEMELYGYLKNKV